MDKLTLADDTLRVPAQGDTVIVRFAGMEKAAIVLEDPEPDSPGRHRLDLMVLAIPPFRPEELTPPGTDLDGNGWFWRTADLQREDPLRAEIASGFSADFMRAQATDAESLLTRLMEAESTPSQGEATVNFLKGEIHEAVKEAQILGVRLAQAQVAADDQETIKVFPTEFELRAATAWMLLKQLNSTAIEAIEDAAPGFFAAVVLALRGEDPTEGDLDDFVATRLAALKRYRDETNG